MKRILIPTAAATVLALSTALPVAAQDAQLSGAVAEVFGAQVVVATPEGRLLVTLPEGTEPPAQGAQVEITGTRDGATLAATALTVTGAAAPAVPAANAPAEAALPQALQGLGLTEVRSRRDDDDTYFYARLPQGGWLRAETEGSRLKEVQSDGADLPAAIVSALLPQVVQDEPRLAEIARLNQIELDDDGEISVKGHAEDGMRVEIEFDRAGALSDYERERDDRRSLSAADARARLEALGYTEIGFVERGGRHVDAVAVNPHGDQVEVRLDDQGRVERERLWMR
ncbi:hypothetical protein LX76_04182 [Cereibacter changlensis]|uniref:Prevent-host-death protein n=1 Tax=Cereibacter changlensis TaxID=402884 RepID=A0A2W7QKF9_9RHOB|nr:prevent-host-death protein [Cereibacter changlensis]PZX48611.1 hypothetical protein LX76_04182 [Cereibacter changlensis]